MSVSKRSLGKEGMDYFEGILSGVGALGAHTYVVPRMINPMFQAAAVGVGTAAGGAVSNILGGTAEGYRTSIDIQDSILDIIATGTLYYFGHKVTADMLGDAEVAAFVLGAIGNMVGQQLPKIGFINDMLKKTE